MNNNYHCHRIVVKIGSSTLTHDTGHLDLRRIEVLVRTLSDLRNAGLEVVLVSSGAVSAGLARMHYNERPHSLEEKQALAAVGQSDLMKIYDSFFANYGKNVGQILMTRDVVDHPARLTLVKNTFATLLRMGVIPIVNENDSVSSEELQFGGNDTLSAYVAICCGADLLINLSDIDGLYNKDPRRFPDAEKLDRVEKITDEVRAMAGGAGSDRGTGGMSAKIRAAEIAGEAGIPMLILNGRDPSVLYRIMDGDHVGTYFAARRQ